LDLRRRPLAEVTPRDHPFHAGGIMVRFAVVLIPFVVVAAACGDAAGPVSATDETVAQDVAFSRGAAAGAASLATGRRILMLDACDPPSFNEAFGFEVCNPIHARAGIPFSTFIGQLERKQRVAAWRFTPEIITVTRTTSMEVINMGGIPHSFTEVEEFGGGFVPILNLLSGNLTLAPECVHPLNPTAPHPDVVLLGPGEHETHTFHPGTEKKYICCIHPWMRAVTR
jgi:hypothetical protein